MGLDFEMPEPGCCGMAGSFGFEPGEHYDVSMACGERNLLPAVRAGSPDTLIIADGFSCHEQIAQGADRRPLHLAQVIRMALPHGMEFARKHATETGLAGSRHREIGVPALALAAAGVGLAGIGIWSLIREKLR